MSACLIDRFFAEEFNDHVRAVVEEAAVEEAGVRYLTFNVFNVAVDLDSGLVTVEDELDPSAECTVSLAAFLERGPGRLYRFLTSGLRRRVRR